MAKIAQTKPADVAAFDCFNTCIKCAEENGVPAKEIIILRNVREKVLNKDYNMQRNRPHLKSTFAIVSE